jgi:hypothetical protein
MGQDVYPEDRSRVARNPEHPTEDDIQNRPWKPRNRKSMAFVVVIAGVAGALYATSHHSTHVAIVTASFVDTLAKKKLVVTYDNATVGKEFLNVTKGGWAYFNETSTGGFVIITSLEFSSPSSSLSFFNSQYHSAVQIFVIPGPGEYILKNSSYDSFNYFFFKNASIKTFIGTTVAVVCYSGSYAFTIYDANIPLSSYTSLIDGEIQAMT